MNETIGVPYHRAVRGPDGKYWWAECPKCGLVVENKDGYGAGRHWRSTHDLTREICAYCRRKAKAVGQKQYAGQFLCAVHLNIAKKVGNE